MRKEIHLLVILLLILGSISPILAQDEITPPYRVGDMSYFSTTVQLLANEGSTVETYLVNDTTRELNRILDMNANGYGISNTESQITTIDIDPFALVITHLIEHQPFAGVFNLTRTEIEEEYNETLGTFMTVRNDTFLETLPMDKGGLSVSRELVENNYADGYGIYPPGIDPNTPPRPVDSEQWLPFLQTDALSLWYTYSNYDPVAALVNHTSSTGSLNIEINGILWDCDTTILETFWTFDFQLTNQPSSIFLGDQVLPGYFNFSYHFEGSATATYSSLGQLLLYTHDFLYSWDITGYADVFAAMRQTLDVDAFSTIQDVYPSYTFTYSNTFHEWVDMTLHDTTLGDFNGDYPGDYLTAPYHPGDVVHYSLSDSQTLFWQGNEKAYENETFVTNTSYKTLHESLAFGTGRMNIYGADEHNWYCTYLGVLHGSVSNKEILNGTIINSFDENFSYKQGGYDKFEYNSTLEAILHYRVEEWLSHFWPYDLPRSSPKFINSYIDFFFPEQDTSTPAQLSSYIYEDELTINDHTYHTEILEQTVWYVFTDLNVPVFIGYSLVTGPLAGVELVFAADASMSITFGFGFGTDINTGVLVERFTYYNVSLAYSINVDDILGINDAIHLNYIHSGTMGLSSYQKMRITTHPYHYQETEPTTSSTSEPSTSSSEPTQSTETSEFTSPSNTRSTTSSTEGTTNNTTSGQVAPILPVSIVQTVIAFLIMVPLVASLRKKRT